MGASAASLSDLKAEHLKKLADRALASGNCKDAWLRYTAAADLGPGKDLRQRLMANRSLAYFKGQRYREALQDAELLLQERPSWDKAWFRQGSALQGLQQLTSAVAAYRKAYYLSSGDAGCEKALWQALQRLTREELGSTILHLISELQLKGGIPAASLEAASEGEMVEAMFLHIKSVGKAKEKGTLPQSYQMCMAWATKGIPPAVALTQRSIMYTHAKCYAQGAADARVAIEMLLKDQSTRNGKGSAFQWHADVAAAHEAMGAALLAEPDHRHRDQTGAVKAFMMAVEHAPKDDALRDRLHLAEEALSAEQLAEAQRELYNAGARSSTMHLVHGVLEGTSPGGQQFVVDVAVHLPQASMQDVGMAVRTALRDALATACGLDISRVQLKGVRSDAGRTSAAADGAPGTAGKARGPLHRENQAGSAPAVVLAFGVHVGSDEGIAQRLVNAVEGKACFPESVCERFPDSWASAACTSIATAQAESSASQRQQQELARQSAERAIMPVRPQQALALPYGSYRLVHAEGQPMERADKHPFCMSRVHYSAADRPHEVWAELTDGSCRWRQTGSEVKVIALQVPRQTPARNLIVRLDAHEVSIAHKHTGEVYLQGRLWRGIIPLESVWTQSGGEGEDGCLLLLRKMNLELLARHWAHSEMWWARLFKDHTDIAWDDYDKDYSDLPPEILSLHRALEAQQEGCQHLEAAHKSARNVLEERNDLRKQRRQARLHEMRTGSCNM